MDLPFLTSYERSLVNHWVEAGQVSHTANGIVPITWDEIDAWARRFHTEQYVEWVEQSRPLRADGLPDERYKPVVTPLRVTQCTLTDWELQMIKRMSQEYISEVSNTAPNRPCPKEVIAEDLDEDQKLTNAKAVDVGLRSLFCNEAHANPAVEAA